MRKHISHITLALAFAALGIACSGRNTAATKGNDRAERGGTIGTDQRVSLVGCVQPAPNSAEGKFILEHVVTSGMPGTGPTTRNGPGTPLIPRGSWVRLEGQGLEQYNGKQVEVSGWIANPGLNTIGTGGRANAQEQHMPRAAEANGDAPHLRVETVKKQADSCAR
jgi:hypothetical protein